MSDGDLPSVFRTETRKARKIHVCYECRKKIQPGEQYLVFTGCWEGKWEEYKTCQDCADLREELSDRGTMAPFGDLGEWAYEAGIEFERVG